MIAAAKTINVPALAVDVGFFSTKFTLGRTSNGERSEIMVSQFPSVTPRIFNGMNNLPNAAALDGVLIEVEPGVSHFVGKDVLNTVKAHGTRAVIPNFSETSGYKALFLGALFNVARHFGATTGLVIKQMVVGLPLTTLYTHHESLKTFVEGEHIIPNPSNPNGQIKVVIQHALVVAQPHGALISHGVTKFGAPTDSTTLVLDMGGGTFDWFVSKGAVPNHQRCGAAPIGALACATAVCDQIHPDLKDDNEILARVDLALREGAKTVKITGRDHDMQQYWPAVKGVLQDAVEQMQKSVGSLRSIDAILLTGGGAKLLAKVAADMLPDFAHLMEIDANPVESNVRGFHVIAELYSA